MYQKEIASKLGCLDIIDQLVDGDDDSEVDDINNSEASEKNY